jgi:hypothetical protein
MSQYSDEYIARRLEKPRRSGKGWRCCCPAHDDKEPSFDIEDGIRGRSSSAALLGARKPPSSTRCVVRA